MRHYFNAPSPVVCLWCFCSIHGARQTFTCNYVCTEWLFNLLLVQHSHLLAVALIVLLVPSLFVNAGKIFSFSCVYVFLVLVWVGVCVYLCPGTKVCPTWGSFGYWVTDFVWLFILHCIGIKISTFCLSSALLCVKQDRCLTTVQAVAPWL